MRYAIVIEKSLRDYALYVPDLPGCVATGASRKAVQEISEAIRVHIESLRGHVSCCRSRAGQRLSST